MVNRLLDARAEDAIYNRILLQRWIDLYFIAGKQQSQQEKCQQARQQVVAAMGPSVRNALLWTAHCCNKICEGCRLRFCCSYCASDRRA